MGKKKITKEPKGLSVFEKDCIWMSIRYCIGRHTIASQMHADGIANCVYKRMPKNYLLFLSQDINQEIYDQLQIYNWLNIDYYYNIPKTHFKPLDVLYRGMDGLDIRDSDKMRKIKTVDVLYNSINKTFQYEAYYNETDRQVNHRSIHDFKDLEVWQRLANLLDVDSHKWCKLIDGTIVEYYEYWRTYFEDGKAMYEKVKEPIEEGRAFNFMGCLFIPNESILEDDINPNKE